MKQYDPQDIRNIGSGNIGATNVLRTGNKIIGYSTLILDILKAVIPVLFIKFYIQYMNLDINLKIKLQILDH